MREGIYRLLIVLVVFVLPLLYLFQQALFDPAIEFLPPSLSAGWVFHPVQEILNLRSGPVSRDVLFRRRFILSTLPRHLEFRVRAFRKMALEVNGRTVSFPNVANWKTNLSSDLARYLLIGANEVTVRVENDGAIPALLVESPSEIQTPEEWEAALGPNFNDFRPVIAALQPGPAEPLASMVAIGSDPGPFQGWVGWRGFRRLIAGWLMLLGAVAAWVLWREAAKETVPVLGAVPGTAPKRERVTIFIILAGALILTFSNALQYPYDRTNLDPLAHADYVQYVARTWKTPSARDGFEMFQPPLYYYCAAAIYRVAGGEQEPARGLKAVQFLGAFSGFALSVLTWLFVRRLFPAHTTARWIATVFAAFLPMSLYMSPLISNEIFSAAVIAAAIYALILLAERQTLRTAMVAAILTGLALLSKYTAVFTLAAGTLFLAERAVSGKNRQRWVLASYLGVALLISGWLYWRNCALYGDPFIGNWDQASGFHYEQNPGYRTAGFYLRFGQVFFHHPERSTFISWLDGTYASMWGDVYRNLIDAGDERAYFWIGVVWLLATLPTQAILIGFAATLISALRRPLNTVDFILLAIPVWTWIWLILFSMELPFASTVKAFFFLSLVPILGVYLIRGREILIEHAYGLRWALDFSVILIAVFSIRLYAFS